jgi:membrane-associated phospholipid phosphatase
MLFESDKFAAFPSLHVAYVIFLSMVYFVRLGKYFSYTAYPVTIGVIFSVIYLGQHYVIDVLGWGGREKAAYCIVAYLIAEKLFFKQ